jgi:hypothetical protein
MKDFDRSILVGVVFDLSLAHAENGLRNIDIVKESLLKILQDKPMARIFVSHPDWQAVPRSQGESTYYVVSYQEPQKFAIDPIFKNAVTVIGECAEDCDRYVFLITDRFQAPVNFQYRKGFLSNNIRGYETKICVFGIGDNYDRLTLNTIADEYGVYFAHLPTAAALSDKLTELFVVGA